MNIHLIRTLPARAALCAALASVPLTAQDLTVEAAPPSGPVALLGATIHTGDGSTIENGVLWFRDGRIAGLGESAAAADVPAAATRIDLGGRHLWPGLIAAVTQVGLIEIGSVSATRDVNEIGDVTPEAWAAVAINPDATTIPVTRSNGVLTVGAFPSGGTIPGRASVIELAGWTWEEMSIRRHAGMVLSWPGAPVRRAWQSEADHRRAVERAAEARAEIDALFDDAAAWMAAHEADPETVATDVRFAAMAPVLRGEQRLFVRANDAASIRDAIGWGAERGLRMVLVGGADAARCTGVLQRHDVPVIITGIHRLPRRRDHAPQRPFRLPRVLQDAGIRYCIAGDGSYANERNLPYHAATAVAHGLTPEQGLRAITLSAAECLGVADELGSLTVGKRATLIVTDGHPLEITTQVLQAWASGRPLDLTNKQTRLAEKYRERYRQLGLWPDR